MMSWRPTAARSSPRRSSRSSRRRSGIATRRPESTFPPPIEESLNPAVVVIFGPTAVGKSELLGSLLDSRFELINADSMQVYRHMDIGTAKPSLEERGRIPHHL